MFLKNKWVCFGEKKKTMLEDISIITGAKLFSEDLGNKIENVNIADLGKARKIIISRNDTTIINGYGKKNEIKKRCEQIKAHISNSNSCYDNEKLQERLAKLSGGIAILKVGGITEIEVKEKKDRVEDAYNATKAAIEEGIVPGGGSALLYISRFLKDLKGKNSDENVGIQIVRKALLSPIKRIIKNAGLESSLIIEKLIQKRNFNITFDAQKNKIVDAFEEGIVDPTKVVKNALQSATSIASLLISTESTISKAEKFERISSSEINNLPKY